MRWGSNMKNFKNRIGEIKSWKTYSYRCIKSTQRKGYAIKSVVAFIDIVFWNLVLNSRIYYHHDHSSLLLNLNNNDFFLEIGLRSCFCSNLLISFRIYDCIHVSLRFDCIFLRFFVLLRLGLLISIMWDDHRQFRLIVLIDSVTLIAQIQHFGRGWVVELKRQLDATITMQVVPSLNKFHWRVHKSRLSLWRISLPFLSM